MTAAQPGEEFYVRAGEALSLGAASLKGVEYVARENRFARVVVLFDASQLALVRQWCVQEWGREADPPTDSFDAFMGEQWSDGPGAVKAWINPFAPCLQFERAEAPGSKPAPPPAVPQKGLGLVR